MRRSRRSLLATAASATGVVATAGSAALAGCSTFSGSPNPVRVLAAGSLQRAFDDGLRDAVDAPVVYESMATDHGYDAIDLSPQVDLSNPGRADAYADATYDLPDGGLVRGDAIKYGATLRSPEDDAARGVFEELLGGDYLHAHGFEVPDALPRFTRDAPDALADR